MQCMSSNTYSTCANGAWGVSQSCGGGLVCAPSGNYIYCVRPTGSTPTVAALPEPIHPTTTPTFDCIQSLYGFQVCSSNSTYKICVAGEEGPTWSVDLSCQEGLSCHPSQTANNIYCY